MSAPAVPQIGLWGRIIDWAISIDRRPRSLLWLGVAMLVFMAMACVVVFASFRGQFTSYATVTVALPATSTAVLPGSPVEYREVKVGEVASEGRTGPGGTILLTVHMQPDKLARIPATVRATVQPISLFGNQYVVLTPPADADAETLRATPALRAGDTVAALEGPTNSVQQTVADLDHLLLALHPGQLNAALTAVAQALQGQGTSLGQTLVAGSTYLKQMQPLWATVVKDLQTLVPVADQLAASTPNLIDILGNSAVTATTINDNKDAVTAALTNGAHLSGLTADLLTSLRQPIFTLAAASGPFLDDISRNPREIAQLLAGLDGFANSVRQSVAGGPFLRVTATVAVANPANLALAALAGPDMLAQLSAGLGHGLVNPHTYTAADRPHFDAHSVAAAAAAVPHVLPVLSASSQQSAVGMVASALAGADPASTPVATLLLSPLLAGLGHAS